jgi:D-alanyl-D-alanine carboxypeptidase/D-alanyl-D-alanine-endopeptidase (penicillin-binding protein 4)
MKRPLIRCPVFLLALLVLPVSPRQGWPDGGARSTDEFRRKAMAHIERKTYAEAHWGVMAMDLSSGREIFAYDSEKLFMPASNRKLFTTAFALDVLGGDFEFHTRLERDGHVGADGTLKGDLIVRASGDPTISSRFRADQNTAGVFRDWARAAAKRGIRRVDGSLIVDTSCFAQPTLRGEGWAIDNESAYYAAAAGAFSLNENVVTVRITPGSSSEQRCKIALYPESNAFLLRNETHTSSKNINTVEATRESGSNVIVVKGSLYRRAKPDYCSVAVGDPARFAASVLLGALEEEGIEVDDGARIVSSAPESTGDAGDLIAEHCSPPLSEIIKEVNRSSNNNIAEMIYLAAGRKATGSPASYEIARQAEEQFWKRLGLSDAPRLYAADGCGLSRRNLFTPRSFCELLRHMQQHKEREVYVRSLAVNGQSGTLAGRMTSSAYRRRVLAKTGYIANVSGLSGYLVNQEERTLVFSILVNHFDCSNSSIKTAQDQLCQWLIDLRGLSGLASAGLASQGGGT